MLELLKIRKRFMGNSRDTLAGADWDLREGEIHALLGENGAGKSTLMHIAAGFLRPDEGEIRLKGAPVRFASPAAARKNGIGMTRQRPELCPEMPVWEYAALSCGTAAGKFFFDRRQARRRAAAAAAQYNLNIDTDAQTTELNDAGRHMAAALALLLSGARYLIFDEPSAALNAEEARALRALLWKLAADGRAVALLTHNLDEALSLACRITVMRNGRTLSTRPASEWTKNSLSQTMFGIFNTDISIEKSVFDDISSVNPNFDISMKTPVNSDMSKLALRVSGLNAASYGGRAALRDICLDVRAGEILAVTGLPSDGIETLELTLCGYLTPLSGKVSIFGKDVTGNLKAFREAGGAFLASGRRRSFALKGGLIEGFDRALSIYDNLIIHRYAEAKCRRSKGMFDAKALNALVDGIKERARIKARSKRRLGVLSGGMLQRLMLERELEWVTSGALDGAAAGRCGLLVVSGAFWGLDLEQRRRLGRKISAAATGGAACGGTEGGGLGVLLFTSSGEDVDGFCHKVFVLEKGHLV
ncbi:MAG: ATP-binding cassette domain-containing protein [Spirochaetaceae bacterium]|jgi:simple sugar transport system ATP-binding protein|nr:ATP-binding cassette domain-containing protein [Spirochaetaceae bacterium]